MLRNPNPSSHHTQSLHQRRHQQARHDWTLPSSAHFDIPFSSFDHATHGLDLSFHRPNSQGTSFCDIVWNGTLADLLIDNRFSPLAAPLPTVHRDREYVVSGHRRRSRNSRGTKEAKRRRDARRNRRKFAAQLLNEQLSRDIDETLTRASIPPRPPAMSLPAVAPAPSFSPYLKTPLSNPSGSPSTTLRLPLLDFGSLDFGSVPHLATPSPSPPPLNVMPNLWCPNIPSRMQDGAWIGDLPKFFDLSHLPEPKKFCQLEPKGQELQLWRPNPVPKKQSRFFPAPTLPAAPRPTVKLPPISCRLHRSETAACDVETASPGQPPLSIANALERLLDLAYTSAPDNAPNAANLWSILRDETSASVRRRHEHVQSSWDRSEDGGVAIPIFDRTALPTEVKESEIPYVHQNSLTGYGYENELAYASRTASPHDSAIFWRDAATQTSVSITPVYELSALPLTPQTPLPDLLGSEIFPPVPQTCDITGLKEEAELANSTAHYTSEQQLFEAVQVPLPPSRPDSPCDLATFLAMGHDENCWCHDCEEAPEMVREEETFTDEDEGWMLWSTTDDEADLEIISAATTPQPITPTGITDDEQEVSRRRCAVVSEWEDFLRSKPEHHSETEEEAETDFLGYFDDGPAFARESEYDWI